MKIDGFNNTDLAKFSQPTKPAGGGSSSYERIKVKGYDLKEKTPAQEAAEPTVRSAARVAPYSQIGPDSK